MVLCGLLVAGASSGAATRPSAGHAATIRSGFAVVRYAATGAAPLPWNAHLLSGTNPALTTLGGPRTSPDAQGATQLVFRNPQGHAIWMVNWRRDRATWVDLTALSYVAPLRSEPVAAVSPAGNDEVFFVTTSGHLLVLSYQPNRRVPIRNGPDQPAPTSWWRTDLTQVGGGPPLAGTPSVVVFGATTAVFARTQSGDLVEYVNDNRVGRPWNGYDLSVISGGPHIASDPTGFYDPTVKQFRVAATEAAPAHGDVVVFSPTDLGGRVWNFQDVSAATKTQGIGAGVSSAVIGTSPTLFGASPNGDLIEYTGTDATSTSTTWRTTDLSATVTGAPQIAGTPSVAVAAGHVAIGAVAASWGDLFVWVNNGAKGAFTATDVSITGTGPTRTVQGTPAVSLQGGVPVLYAAGVAVPAPEGTGVYAVPWTKWSQALKDGWPVLGVTGGLGTQCAPWTGYQGIGTSTPPDEYVGQTIQQSHLRETWLSFWTVSGPRTAPGAGCTAEKGAVTAATYYQHGFAAGAWVATQIDKYRGDGLALKPDWVIFDPEGYPDNHSGLWGPTSPPAKLTVSVSYWYAMLSGWRAGIVGVDPALKPALYANQYEYMAYRLYNQPLPTFIAGVFDQQVVKGHKVLVPPARTAFGPNIRGFVMYNDFNPTCTQVTNERLVLTRAPWSGAYNLSLIHI